MQQQKKEQDVSREALAAALADARRVATLLAKVTYMARRRYHLQSCEAQDLFQDAVETWLRVNRRYPPDDNHFGLLIGIFHRKALEHLDAKRRDQRLADRLIAKLFLESPLTLRGEDSQGDTVTQVIRSEDARFISEAIGALDPAVRSMLLALADGSVTRREIIAQLRLNPNTFDTRLRALRLELRNGLAPYGIAV